MSLASEIKKHAGTELAELLSELKHLRAERKKGHASKVIYMIDTTTQIGGKLHEAGCGFSPCFFGSLKECESAIRACANACFKQLEADKCKPRILVNYESDKIAKGAVRVYYTEKRTKKSAIREFRPVSFELANTLEKAKELMGLNDK
ncbi:MAG: hypothetical protein SPJ69_07225 [Campylobacter sp.]|uniref:hypothetical protein n=1 Tax=Campylobacter sp. TaxID=205 RepID=UPI002975C562|nr:hypothetical protein [Campylobacter sp.]MDD7599225.1 hypothetical protein [Campylobacteraceae bacterium]MDY5888094.1 hypothetical protein [Campylobacter sp.]